MRFLGVLMVVLGGGILGALAMGKKPLDLVKELIDLLGHQHQSGPARNVVGSVSGATSNLLGQAGAAAAGAAAGAAGAAGSAAGSV